MITVAAFLHAVAMLAYPKQFRAHFGRELSEVFRRRLESSSPAGIGRTAALAAWLVTDAVISGLAERIHRMSRAGLQDACFARLYSASSRF